MNNDNQMHAPMNGNDELAKALNGDMNFEETPMPGANPHDDSSQSQSGQQNDAPYDNAATNGDDEPPTLGPAANDDTSSSTPELDKIKTSAIGDLRPLIGKLDLPPEEKFDTLLLFIRSTDDTSLLQETYQAAKEITDESRRAKALLDVIREVSYFSNKK